MDTTTTIAVVVAAVPSILMVGWKLVEWSFARNVKHADDSQKKVETVQEKQERELNEVRGEVAALRVQIRDEAHAAAMSAHDVRTQLTALAATIGELKGALTGIRESFEQGREKQAEFYRGELAKVEQTFRQELSRNSHPDLPERVSRLERDLEPRPKRKLRG